MTRSRQRLAALMTAALAAAPALAAPSFELLQEKTKIVEERDPDEAARFLSDVGLQNRLNNEDHAASLEIFQKSAELEDLRELLRTDKNSVYAVRDGLADRPDCTFCQDEHQLTSWVERYKIADPVFVRTVVFNWESLDPTIIAWLGTQGQAPSEWAEAPFTARRERLLTWANARYAEFMKARPRVRSEMPALWAQYQLLFPFLERQNRYALSNHITKDETAVNNLDEARKLVAKTNDPKLAAALAAAQNAPDVESQLSGLSAIFDGLHVSNVEIHATAPTPAGQGFDAQTARTVSEALGPSLLELSAGTWAGDETRKFYAAHRLSIEIKPLGPTAIAEYIDDKMAFDQRHIEEFLNAHGRSARDLLRDAPLLNALSEELVSTFVHEATHHRQEYWAKSLGIRDSFSQYGEVEAMETEAFFLLEKEKRDPAFKRYLKNAAQTSNLASESQSLADKLESEGPDAFRSSIRARYSTTPSLEAESSKALAANARMEKLIRAEIERRRKLPRAEQERLYWADPAGEDVNPGNVMKRLRSIGTLALKGSLKDARAEDADEAKAYAQHRARAERINREIEQRLKALEKEPDPTKPTKPDPVPPPVVTKTR